MLFKASIFFAENENCTRILFLILGKIILVKILGKNNILNRIRDEKNILTILTITFPLVLSNFLLKTSIFFLK